MDNWKAGTESLVDETLPTPLYHQVFLFLKEKIRRGELGDQTPLPGEIQLSEVFGVSRITMKRALADLAAEGLVSRRRGLGTFVTNVAAPPPLVNGSFDNWIENLDVLDREITMRLLEVSEVAADLDVAGHLGLTVGSPLQRVTRLRNIAGTPFAHVVAYIPAELAAAYPPEQLQDTPMLTLLERAGASAAEAEQWISAVLVPGPVATAMEMATTDPALKLEQVIRDGQGRAVQFLRVYYHPDRFRYHVKIQRQKAGTEKPAAEMVSATG